MHGLIKPGEESFQFLQILKAIKNLDSLIIVFPLGLEGAFSYHSDMLGWTPKYFDDNKLFLKKIIANLEKDYGINTANVIAGGFSNGAYFLSQILQSKDAEIFSGFWLQGGGNAYVLEPNLVKRKVFLEVGCLDTGNVESVRELKSHLLQYGWKENKNLFYTELNQDHQLHINDIEKILMILEINK